MTDSAVAAIVAVRDGERYLTEALDSILAQTRQPAEIVVVDDGSRDGSPRIAEGYAPEVRCLRRPPRGPSAALNTGIEATSGELLAFLDADDLWLPKKLELQCEALARDPSLDMVFGTIEQFVSPELGSAARARLRSPQGPAPGKVKGAMLVRRSSFERVGAFDPGRTVAEFIDWYARAMEHDLRDEVLPELVIRRRLHEHNLGRTGFVGRVEYAQALGAALRRRSRRPSPGR
jgi:glycosyltransferase involved in cell wall biosynthesis